MNSNLGHPLLRISNKREILSTELDLRQTSLVGPVANLPDRDQTLVRYLTRFQTQVHQFAQMAANLSI